MSETPDPGRATKRSTTPMRPWHKRFAARCNNRAWDLASRERTPAEDREMLDAAHASAWHWAQVGSELNRMRATMLLADVHAELGMGSVGAGASRARCTATSSARDTTTGSSRWRTPSSPTPRMPPAARRASRRLACRRRPRRDRRRRGPGDRRRDLRAGCRRRDTRRAALVWPAARLRVGLISDTHGLLPAPGALAFLAGSDHIVHGGDICDAGVLDALAAIAPVTAVRGNNDRGAWAERLRESELVRVGDVCSTRSTTSRRSTSSRRRRRRRSSSPATRTGPRSSERDGVLYVNSGQRRAAAASGCRSRSAS